MSEVKQGHLDRLQLEIQERLSQYEPLSGISVISELSLDPEQDAETAVGLAMAKAGGLCIILAPPVGNVTNLNLPGPFLGNVPLEVNVFENVLLNQGANGRKLTASYVAELIANRLHHWQTSDKKTVLVLKVGPKQDPEFRVYAVSIKTAFGLSAPA